MAAAYRAAAACRAVVRRNEGQRDEARRLSAFGELQRPIARTTLARHKTVGSVEYIRAFDYVCAGKSVHITDEIDLSLVKPRERKYEQAGAASAVAQGAAASVPPAGATTANAKLEVR